LAAGTVVSDILRKEGLTEALIKFRHVPAALPTFEAGDSLE
jgi:hypothetical protein